MKNVIGSEQSSRAAEQQSSRAAEQQSNVYALLEFVSSNYKLIFIALLIIQAIGLIASLIYSDSYSTPDTITYIIPAEKFLTTGIMLDETNTPIWFRTPGYPLVLAIIYWLADLFKINFDKNFIVLGLQALMCILNSCMIFYCVNKIAGNNKKAYGVLAVLFFIYATLRFTITPVL